MATELTEVLARYGLRHIDSSDKIYKSNPFGTIVSIHSEGFPIYANVAEDLESIYDHDTYIFHLYDDYYLKMLVPFVTCRNGEYELKVPFKVVKSCGSSVALDQDIDFISSNKTFFIGLRTKVRLTNSSGLFKRQIKAEAFVNFHVHRDLMITDYKFSGDLVRENVKIPLSNHRAFSGAYFDVWETLKELVKEHIYPRAMEEARHIAFVSMNSER